MATEEQTDVSILWSSLSANTQWGQRLTISSRTLSKLSFYLKRTGTVNGMLTFLIRAVSGDAVLVTKDWGIGNGIGTTAAWYEVTFDTPTLIDEEVYLTVKCTSGSINNFLQVYAAGSDVKASEYIFRRDSGVYSYNTGRDFGYIYTYTTEVAPTVTTQAVTDIAILTATGNGNITNLGSPNPTAHGVCWNTGGTPTTADDKTDEGAAGATGAFTSSIIGLTANTLYYVRAYATNSYGTSYGSEVSFTTLLARAAEGYLWGEGTKVHIIDENKAEQSFEGALVVAGSHPEGTLWLELTKFHNIDTSGDERSQEGTATGDTSDPGYIHIEGAHLHGIDESGDERYL